ncbi:MAK10-like protein [Tanacetum coccineum]
MEAHLTPTQPTQVNKVTTSCEICSGPYDTQYCMEDPEQALVEYASSRTDEAGGLVSNFMASQDARLSKFEADFKQQQSEMINKIDTVLKAIIDQIAGALPSDTVKNPKLSGPLVLSACSYPSMNPQCSNHVQGSIKAITIHSEKQSDSYDEKAKENEEEEKDNPKNIHVNPSTPPDPSISFITEKVLKFNSFFESPGLVPQSSNTEERSTTTEEVGVEYFDIFPTRSELAYHKYLMCSLISSIFLRNPIITEGCPSNLKIPCNIRHVHVKKAYIDPSSSLNIMTRMMYNWIMRRKLDPKENSNKRVSNFTGRFKGMHVFVGNFTYIVDFMIVEDISSIIDPSLSQVVLRKPFVEIYNMTHDSPEGVVRFINGTDEIAYKMPHIIEQYNSLSHLEKEHTKSVYLRNEEDKRRGVEYVMSKILGFYKECLELGPEYVTGMDNEREITKIVLAVASSGIASLLLPSGRIAYSWFKLPLELTDSSVCSMTKNTQLAPLLKETDLIIWDKSPMNDRQCFETLDKTLKDILDTSNKLFGSKTVMLGGDFRQTLLVKKSASRTEIISSSIAESYLWRSFKLFVLTENMR